MQMQLASSYAGTFENTEEVSYTNATIVINDYAFSRANRHSRGKPFKCNPCGYASPQASHLRRHLINDNTPL